MSWRLVYTKQAQKLNTSGLEPKAEELLALTVEDPYRKPPSFEKLVGDLAGAYSWRIDIQTAPHTKSWTRNAS